MMPLLLGLVLMLRGMTGAWEVRDPFGGLVDISQSRSQGLQEAINYAHANNRSLVVIGGGQNTVGGDPNAIFSDVPILIPSAAKTSYRFHGVSLWFRGAANNNGLGLVFDCMDMLDFEFSGQIIYPGIASAVTILCRTPFVEWNDWFSVVTSSRIKIGSIAIIDQATGYTRPSHGTALAIVGPAPITFLNIEVLEINGGIRPYWIVDSTFFGWNKINLSGVHNVAGPGIQTVNHAPNKVEVFGPGF